MSSQDIRKAPTLPKYCRRCKCHDINSTLKGHKAFCQFKNCECSKCCLIPRTSRKTRSQDDEVIFVKTKVLNGKCNEGNQQADKVNTNEVTSTNQGQNQPMAKAGLVTTSTDVPEQNSPAATQEARAKILQLVRELHDLKECGALSNEEFEEKKGVILRDF
ncbi:unnamed protein product [Pocillopora meandrina]|uniref:DM domain-containing protein n=1 Tax=Pocillopora meandrina TaxID=46732 RepID=A0AAU9WY78_9CNID|nr:unnamed protein product [Pocillopora meandrina]